MAEGWEIVEVVGSDEEAELIAGFLRNREIPCEVESVHSHEFPVTVNPLGELRIQVPVDRAEEARRVLAEVELDYRADEA